MIDREARASVALDGETHSVDTAETGAVPELLKALEVLFADLPIEDGCEHPAEQRLEVWLERFPLDGVAALTNVLEDGTYPRSPELLRCLGRLPYHLIRPHGAEIIRMALASKSIPLRDAAVRAFELWREPSLVPVVREHTETVAWLAEYIRRVL
jgi:hypothetical protein